MKAEIQRKVEVYLLVIAGIFVCLHGLHLKADFPNHSPWMDWAKYTDEGWYGDAAIRYFQHGYWYVRGDFNPAVALPVWPLLESAVFSVFGVSLESARGLVVGVFGLMLVAVYLLMRRFRPYSLTPSIAVLLLAVSPFVYAFTRMAILEPLLILLTLMALLVAAELDTGKRWPAVGLGLLLPLMVLTKTTAVFLVPAVFWMVWARANYERKGLIRLSWLPCVIAAGVWLVYFGVLVRPRYLADYKYLFEANQYTDLAQHSKLTVILKTFTDGIWMGQLLYPLAVIGVIAALVGARKKLIDPLAVSLLLWTGGYLFFLAYHNNLQPRYYLVLAIPVTMLAVLAGEALSELGKISAGAVAICLLAVTVVDARMMLGFVRHPQYTYITAAREISQVIENDTRKNKMMLSISGSNLALMTGLPAICDDFGTMQLYDRVATYKPGWFLTWNLVEDDKMEALAPFYKLTRAAEYPVMDDPDRNLLILYRLDPKEEPPLKLKRLKRSSNPMRERDGWSVLQNR